ncbi:Apoptosis-inducing factor 3 [Liparis tanakae]|uniref:Apoptosis-inducing factor 3 n=1 Tax=Liparis tanakae TaxID=230148 RepID=A0A4Z2ED60_9TELE|nr:Apoptosis-inducing factor 3 [Liparis tanakae]
MRLQPVLREMCLCCAVEVKVELSLLEKEKELDGLSPNGKASPLADPRPNGALGHGAEDDATPPPLDHKPRDYVEASVCHVKDLENGQMREVDVGGGRALLIKEHGEFSAMAHKCPHYGAPLVKGESCVCVCVCVCVCMCVCVCAEPLLATLAP